MKTMKTTTTTTLAFPADTATVARTPLRPAVLGEAAALSDAARREIMALSGARPARFGIELAFTWLWIAVFIALGLRAHNLAVTALCLFMISTRQMVLALLLHEQVHRLGWRSRYADWIINVFAVYPLFVTSVEDYAKVHLSHHKYCFTADDPDFLRKAGEEWTFPMPLTKLLTIVGRDLTGMNVLRLIRGKTAHATTEFTRRNPSPKWLRICFFLSAAGLLTVTRGWGVFLVYWLLPMLTITQLMVRWIAVCEHRYNVKNGAICETTPLLLLNWWQRLFVPDLNFGLHAYHHIHPGVSFSQLPKVHEIYRREGLVDDSAVFHGQGAYLRYLIAK